MRFRKWRSLKAYAILNGLEVVFWGAVVFLVIQANIQVCVGIGCTLSWIAVAVSIIITYYHLSLIAFVCHKLIESLVQDCGSIHGHYFIYRVPSAAPPKGYERLHTSEQW